MKYIIPIQLPLCTVLSVLVSKASIVVLSYILHTYTGSLVHSAFCSSIKGEYRCLCVELYYIPIQLPLCTVLSVLVSKASIDVLSYILHTYTGSLVHSAFCSSIKGEYRCVEIYCIPIQLPLCTVLSVLVSKASIDVLSYITYLYSIPCVLSSLFWYQR